MSSRTSSRRLRDLAPHRAAPFYLFTTNSIAGPYLPKTVCVLPVASFSSYTARTWKRYVPGSRLGPKSGLVVLRVRDRAHVPALAGPLLGDLHIVEAVQLPDVNERRA